MRAPLLKSLSPALLGILLCSGAWSLPQSADAAGIPSTLNYQGRLRLSGGALVPDGNANTLVFALYAQASGGSALWTETQTGVTTTAGLFNVTLGKSVPLSLPFDQPYWLGVSVNGDPEMVPRSELTVAPYAFRAKFAEGVGFPLSGTTTTPLEALYVANNDSAGTAVHAVGQPGFGNSVGVKGEGGTGVLGLATGGGGVGVAAVQGSGAYALKVSGNANFSAGIVDFSGATVTGLSVAVPSPLYLTGSANGGAIISGSNSAPTGYGLAGQGAEVGVSGTAVLGGTGVGVLGQAASSSGAGVQGVNSGSGPGVLAQGQGVGLSATAQNGIAVYGLNLGGGGFVPTALFEASGTNHAVEGRNLINGSLGTLGGDLNNGQTGLYGFTPGTFQRGVWGQAPQGYGVVGEGLYGVYGRVTASGQTAIWADQLGTPGATALQVSGNSLFDGVGNTTTFVAGHTVNFTGATVLGLNGVPNPLSLSNNLPGGSVLSVSQTALQPYSKAIYASSAASSTAAIWGETNDTTAPGPSAAYAKGVYGQGAVGTEGRSILPNNGIGVLGSTPSGGNGGYGVLGLDNGSIGAGVRGEGYRGVWGYSSLTGGTGVMAEQGLGAYALKVSGSASFNGGVVDFSGTTVTGLVLPGGLPLQGALAIAYPGALVNVTNSGTGYGVHGLASQPGADGGNPVGAGTTITAGVFGETGVSLSAGVFGRYTGSNNSAAAVLGLATQAGAGVYGVGLNGATGGSFDSKSGTAVNASGVTGLSAKGGAGGLGAMIQAVDATQHAADFSGTVTLQANSTTAALSVTQSSAAYASPAIAAFSSNSGTAAIVAINNDPNPPQQNTIPGVGVWGQGTVGLAGFSSNGGGIGVVGSANGNSTSAGVRAENKGFGVGLDADGMNNGVGVRAHGLTAVAAYTNVSGGVAVLASGNPGAVALQVQGSSKFNFSGSGDLTSFGGYVDFSGATVTGLVGGGLSFPLYLSGSTPTAAITGENFYGDGTGLMGRNLSGGTNSTGVEGLASSNGANYAVGVLGTFNPSPARPFGGAAVLGDAGNQGYGVMGRSGDPYRAAVYGLQVTSVAGSIGVLGEASNNVGNLALVGVMGSLQGTPVSYMPGTATAVYGWGNFQGDGVIGATSMNQYAGVLGQNRNAGVGGPGVVGEAPSTSTGFGVIGVQQLDFDRFTLNSALPSGAGVVGTSGHNNSYGVAGLVSGPATAALYGRHLDGGLGLSVEGSGPLSGFFYASTVSSGSNTTIAALGVSATVSGAGGGVRVLGLSLTADAGTSFADALGAVFKVSGVASSMGLSISAMTMGGPAQGGYGVYVESNRVGLRARALNDSNANSPAGTALWGEGSNFGVYAQATQTAGGGPFSGIAVAALSSYVGLSVVAQPDMASNTGLAIYAAGRQAAQLQSEFYDTANNVLGASVSAHNQNSFNVSGGALGLSVGARTEYNGANAVGLSVSASIPDFGSGSVYGLVVNADNGFSGTGRAVGVGAQISHDGVGVQGSASGYGVGTAGLRGENRIASVLGSPAAALDLDGGISFANSRSDKPAGRVTVFLGGCAGNNPALTSGTVNITNYQVTSNSIILVTVQANGATAFPIDARVDSQVNGSFNILVFVIGQGSTCPGIGSVDVSYLILNPR